MRFHRLGTAIGILVITASMGLGMGCYRTTVTSQAPLGPEFTERQWFSVAGLVKLSGDSGGQCQNGIARSTSRMAGTDILINIGLSIAGSLAGSAICDSESPTAYAACAQSVGLLVPFLLGSRTVTYSCAAGPVGELPLIPGQSKQAVKTADKPASAE